ncbi:MAG: YdcF family protein [Bacteroidia bacterium]|nr:YdcF family protein [Bacteroidia bacterium]
MLKDTNSFSTRFKYLSFVIKLVKYFFITNLLAAFCFIVLLFFCRLWILHWLGGNLIVETKDLKPSDAIIVFSGSPLDRGNEAAKLWKRHFSETIICTGENIPNDFKVLGINLQECELTQSQLIRQGVDSSKIQLIRKGTSTFEEIDAIREYCQNKNLKNIILVSSNFHTRRINKYIRPKLEDIGVTVQIHGAPASNFEEELWWTKEDGMIFVNNEYMKLLYYWLKY